MQVLIDMATNATWQAWIWGPLMGVVFSVLFAGLTNQPASSAPITVVQTKKVFVQNVNVNVNKSGSSDSEGGLVILAAGFIALIAIVWNYSIYVEEIHYWLWAVLLTMFSVSFFMVMISLLKGQFTSWSWWKYIGVPIIFLGGCGYVLFLAKSNFSPDITRMALKYKAFDFYMKGLNDYGRIFVISHVMGVAIAFVVMVCASVALLHYLALMNQRSVGALHGFWVFLTRVTSVFSDKAWFFLMGFMLLISYLLVEPRAIPAWFTS
ncbi:hypothetical protein [Pseudomonas fluorescens]|uniref:hypothetical protein n=1 Tax=Pseudomonas fluorescens TaxID=294 RepID=UPI000A9C39A3|nr:hypothetical protein [Pseudomonas fluorescens]